ncbi:MAG TPA: ATP-binding protein [Sedimentisphaerales bacterium]|nr:ATP-binding protein [Sedimentisphaerales bacterium]
MIKRAITSKLMELAEKFPVLAVLGPRQSGKTTLVRAVFAEKDYVSLEDLDTRQFAVSDPRGFLASYGRGAVIDEVQRAPDLFSYIQTSIDRTGRPGQFILTGSQNILLQENLSQTLAGRVAILRLLPFSLSELPDDIRPSTLEHYMFAGSYPRIYDHRIGPVDWYPNYIRTYIERDVRLIKNISDLIAFQTFVKMCAGRVGQLLNLSSLGNDCGITHNTAKAWLSILEATYIAFCVRPYHRSMNKRLIKMPKLYFYDTGLVCSLLGIQEAAHLNTHYIRGPLFESMVFSELIKDRWNRGLDENCYFWRDRTGNEIDCILESGGRAVPIEVKAGRTVTEDFFAGVRFWKSLTGPASDKAYVIYGGDEAQQRTAATVLSWKNMSPAFSQV